MVRKNSLRAVGRGHVRKKRAAYRAAQSWFVLLSVERNHRALPVYTRNALGGQTVWDVAPRSLFFDFLSFRLADLVVADGHIAARVAWVVCGDADAVGFDGADCRCTVE
jgi:hypothetical protein